MSSNESATLLRQMIVEGFLVSNGLAMVVGTLLSFLITSWRSRLTWIDWMIALLPTALVLLLLLQSWSSRDCDKYCYLATFGGAGFGLGLPLGLLCALLVITQSRPSRP